MYNLTVDTAHTSFVGEGEWLVHNTGGPGCGTLWFHSNFNKDNALRHMFSRDHINNGIMNLGGSQDEIYNAVLENISTAAGRNGLEEGSNQILTTINGYDTTIRTYVQNGQILNVNAFVGDTARQLGNVINLR